MPPFFFHAYAEMELSRFVHTLYVFVIDLRGRLTVSATEIRCQEMSKGGLAYEVILAEPVSSPIVPKRPISPGSKTPSVEEIEEKLKAAEERRLVIIAADTLNFIQRILRMIDFFFFL